MKNERTSELHKLRTLHLFAGAGGGILADLLLGHHPVCAVEIEPYCQQVLSARQKDGHLPWFPIFDDVQTFDGTPWRGLVDVIAGGFPCQDISAAGKGAGLDGERSGLWSEFARIISEVRPKYVFVENSPAITFRGLDRVLSDLSRLGFDAEWGIISAENVSSPQERKRFWTVAKFNPGTTAIRTDAGWYCKWCSSEIMSGCECDHGEWRCNECDEWTYPFHYDEWDGCSFCGSDDVVDSTGKRGCGRNPKWEYAKNARQSSIDPWDDTRAMEIWNTEPNVDRVVNGIPFRVDRLRCLGNAQIPAVAALAWQILMDRLHENS